MRTLPICLTSLASAVPAFAGMLPSPLGPGPSPLGRPSVTGKVALEQRLGEMLPGGLTFRDESGAAVELRSLVRRPVVLALVQYRCPTLCNQVLNGLVEVLQKVPFDAGRQFDVVIVSIDHREGPELAAATKTRCLKRYDRPGSESGWHFLTGSAEAIDPLAAAVGYRFVYDKHTDQFAHPAGVMLATADGRLSHYFSGISYPPRDLRLGLVEASRNGIGSWTDQVLLLCYHYDPETGRYGPAVMAMLRTGGFLTVAALLAFVAWSARRSPVRSEA